MKKVNISKLSTSEQKNINGGFFLESGWYYAGKAAKWVVKQVKKFPVDRESGMYGDDIPPA